jgi:steroid 5-alpha reductase family enzyme
VIVAAATTAPTVMLAAAGTIVVVMLATWIVSVIVHDASIVDPIWPLGFVAIAWVIRIVANGNATLQWLIVVMVTIWGLRLSAHLAWRKRGAPEDFRYQAMRRHWGKRFWIISLATVFGVQGALMWIVSLPVQLGQVHSSARVGILAVAGVVVWVVGFAFETIGDAQLTRFKADPESAGRVMDQGLWRYTRHPNYFGDACVWWGIALVAAETGIGAFGFIGAVVMTVLLRRVSGVVLLERSLVKRRPGYADYVARTSPFIPRPPRRV